MLVTKQLLLVGLNAKLRLRDTAVSHPNQLNNKNQPTRTMPR